MPGEPIFNFKTAAEKFRVIESPTVAVIIPYDEQAKSILKKVRDSDFPLSFSRKLQLYTVNIYEQEFQALQSVGVLDTIADTYAVLNDMSYYNAETGLILPENGGGEAIFF
jgi:CRISPR-associated endonuclease/helicase Cas3